LIAEGAGLAARAGPAGLPTATTKAASARAAQAIARAAFISGETWTAKAPAFVSSARIAAARAAPFVASARAAAPCAAFVSSPCAAKLPRAAFKSTARAAGVPRAAFISTPRVEAPCTAFASTARAAGVQRAAYVPTACAAQVSRAAFVSTASAAEAPRAALVSIASAAEAPRATFVSIASAAEAPRATFVSTACAARVPCAALVSTASAARAPRAAFVSTAGAAGVLRAAFVSTACAAKALVPTARISATQTGSFATCTIAPARGAAATAGIALVSFGEVCRRERSAGRRLAPFTAPRVTFGLLRLKARGRVAVSPCRQVQRRLLGGRAVGGCLHAPNLIIAEGAQRTGVKAVHADACVGGSKKSHDGVTNGRAQPLHEVLPPLGHDQLHPGVALGLVEDLRFDRVRHSVFETHAIDELLQRRLIGHALHLGQVDAGHLVAGVHQLVGKLAVVGEQQRALGVVVQPADGEDAAAGVLRVVGHGGPALRVGQRGDHPGRLVEEEVLPLAVDADELAVEQHQILRRVDAGPELGDDLAVHLHTAIDDHRLSVTTRSHSRSGEKFLQALHGVHDPSLLVGAGAGAAALPSGLPGAGAGGAGGLRIFAAVFDVSSA
jgi:hypothetical protein